MSRRSISVDNSVGSDIGDLVGRHGLAGPAYEQLERLADLLCTEQAPTAVRDPGRIRTDHLADSLVALELAGVAAAASIADLGTGAGLPGLCLAIARPGSRVWLVESNARKCRFIDGAIELIGLPNATVVNARAELWRDGLERCDLVTARALAPLPVVAEYAAPLLRLGGTLVAWRGRRDTDDEAAGARAAAELGLRVDDPIHVEPYPDAVNRHLHSLVKVAPTPARFPRRPGVARKHPLGARRPGVVDG